MTAVQVGQEFLDIPADLFQPGDRKGAIIDSGTTLAYLPEIIYEPLVKKVHCMKKLQVFRFFFSADYVLINLDLPC